jgi:hypothetical protein
MAGIIDFPPVVKEALDHFADLLPNEPQRRHFAEYLTGLFVADRKNVCGINRAFAQTTDQSCLNRFLTAADYDVAHINQRRLDFLQEEPYLFSGSGVEKTSVFSTPDPLNKYRGTGTETFHRDGKQQLGRGDCQLRDGEGQTRHMHLVMRAYSLLRRQLRQGQAYAWAYQKLTTIGEACRAVLRETLRKTLTWALERGNNPFWTKERILGHLGLLGNQ